MIEILNAKEDLKYATEAVCIRVAHTLKRNQIEQIIKQAVDVYGQDAMLKMIGVVAPKSMSDGPWLVSVDGKAAPMMEHSDFIAAKQEALRLINRANVPATVRIMQQALVLRSTAAVTVTETET